MIRRSEFGIGGILGIIGMLLVLGAAPSIVGAQSQDTASLRRLVEQRFGPRVTQEQILDRLRASGMTQSEVQRRLEQMGYDPDLADHYFDAMEGRIQLHPDSMPTLEELRALEDAGLRLRTHPDSLRADSIRADSAFAAAQRSRIFGRTLFAGATTQFEPVLSGPVPPDYRVGPGDEIWLILTGDVETSYPLQVTSEGFLNIPQVGLVPANGLTLMQLEDRLYTYLGRAYSGVRRGPEATTRFQVSMGRLRANQVFVVGEVERPSGYTMSSLARVFNALYHAGGPNEIGSFRDIIVRRNGRLVASVDLYPYLLHGDASDDIRLEQGDIVHVPPAGPRVKLAGAVRRPGIFELKPGETLRDALAFAGGLEDDAFIGRILIDRILPPGEREPGKDRTLVDIPAERLLAPEAAPIPLRGGDSITVFEVTAERRNRVAVTGGVRRPGSYEWSPGMTLQDLIVNAQGLEEGAYTSRALVYRLQEDRTRRLLRAPLDPMQATSLPLADRDSVVVLRADSLRLPMTVNIAGYVKDPGTYTLAEGMSVRDLVLEANGFTEGANVLSAEVVRPMPTVDRTATTAEVIQVPLADSTAAGDPVAWARDGVPRWDIRAAEFELQRGDRVYVRRAPGYERPQTVKITGEVMMPGEYELGSRETRISEVIARAGGVTPEAYVPGFAILREGRPIAGDLTAALADPMAAANLLLEDGDSLHVPLYDGTVRVSGAVLLEANVLFRRGRSVRDYVERAGGFAENADDSRIVVTYPNGERAVMDRFLVFKRDPRVQPGSEIFVPVEVAGPPPGAGLEQLVTRTTAILTGLLTIMLTLDRLGQ